MLSKTCTDSGSAVLSKTCIDSAVLSKTRIDSGVRMWRDECSAPAPPGANYRTSPAQLLFVNSIYIDVSILEQAALRASSVTSPHTGNQ